MTNEAQNIALAKRDGYTPHTNGKKGYFTKPFEWVDPYDGVTTEVRHKTYCFGGVEADRYAESAFDGYVPSMPDYDTDNEIMRLVRGLNFEQVATYHLRLWDVLREALPMTVTPQIPDMHQATTAQMKEALLRAWGDWEDTK